MIYTDLSSSKGQTQSSDSQLLWYQDSDSHLHLQILSHLSINEFSFLHSEWKVTPFPAQKQCNWERKVTIASKKIKTNDWAWGMALQIKAIAWPSEFKPMWKRKAKWYTSVCDSRTPTMWWEVETGDLEIGRPASSKTANTRQILPQQRRKWKSTSPILSSDLPKSPPSHMWTQTQIIYIYIIYIQKKELIISRTSLEQCPHKSSNRQTRMWCARIFN